MTERSDRAAPEHDGGSEGQAGGPGASDETTAAWPVVRASLGAAADGAMAAVWVLVLLGVVALTGWFSADAGLRWEPRAALRVAADVWALGQGAHLVQPWGAVSIVPLGVTLLSIVAARRAGRRVAARARHDELAGQHVGDGDVAMAAALMLGGYLVVTLLVVVLAGAEESGPSLLRALAGSSLVVAVGALPALIAGTGRSETYAAVLRSVVPGWMPGALRRGAAILALHLGLAAMLLGALLVRHADAGADAISALQPSTLDAVVLGLASLLALPVLTVWTASWLIGPGVTVGAGTLVSPTTVALGPLPAVPFAAALPTSQPPSWLVLVQVSPVLVAIVVTLLLRRDRPDSWALALLQAAVSGLVAAVGLVLLGVATSGSIGPGRLAEVGVPVPQLLATSAAAFSLGAVLAAAALAVVDRRRGARVRSAGDAADDAADTVEIIVEARGSRAFTPGGWRDMVRPSDAGQRKAADPADAGRSRRGR